MSKHPIKTSSLLGVFHENAQRFNTVIYTGHLFQNETQKKAIKSRSENLHMIFLLTTTIH